MIVEERTYHVYTGKLGEVVRMYAEEGTEIQQRHLGHLVGAFTVEIGEPSSIVQLWAYVDPADAEKPKTQRATIFLEEPVAR